MRAKTYFLNLQNITRDNLWGLDFEKATITENDSLESQSLLELVDDRSGLVFLDEADGSVQQQKGADNSEVDPVLKTGSENSSSLALLLVTCTQTARYQRPQLRTSGGYQPLVLTSMTNWMGPTK